MPGRGEAPVRELGADVFRCESRRALHGCLRAVSSRSWFVRHGALVQELIEPPLRDLRILVAGGVVVGAAQRERAPGEWRTNVSLGGHLVHAVPDARVRQLALAAVDAVGGDFAGVDLLPTPVGDYVGCRAERRGRVRRALLASRVGRSDRRRPRARDCGRRDRARSLRPPDSRLRRGGEAKRPIAAAGAHDRGGADHGASRLTNDRATGGSRASTEARIVSRQRLTSGARGR